MESSVSNHSDDQRKGKSQRMQQKYGTDGAKDDGIPLSSYHNEGFNTDGSTTPSNDDGIPLSSYHNEGFNTDGSTTPSNDDSIPSSSYHNEGFNTDGSTTPSNGSKAKIKRHILYVLVALIQCTKVALIGWQITSFAGNREVFSRVVNNGQLALKNLLLRDWKADMETLLYQPGDGQYALYESRDLIEHINHAVEGYYNVEKEAFGFYKRRYTDNMIVEMKYFDLAELEDTGKIFNHVIREKKFEVDVGLHMEEDPLSHKLSYTYNVTEAFEYFNLTEPINSLLFLQLKFSIVTVRVFDNPEKFLCLVVSGSVSFDNKDNNGQVLVDLSTISEKLKCADVNLTVTDYDFSVNKYFWLIVVPTGFSIFFFIAIFLIGGAYCKKHWEECKGDSRKRRCLCQFTYYLWDILSVSVDGLIISGVALTSQHKNVKLSSFDSDALVLGMAFLMSVLFPLKILKFHSWFQALFKTISGAFLSVFTYTICVTVLFLGFQLCGYIVLGPYHAKFRTLETTFCTLFALMFDDDIYGNIVDVELSKTGLSIGMQYFTRVYVCTYVVVFNIIVLNILIAIFVQTYETTKKRKKMKKEKSRRFDLLHSPLTEEDKQLKLQLQKIFGNALLDVKMTDEDKRLKARLEKILGKELFDDTEYQVEAPEIMASEDKEPKNICDIVVRYWSLENFA